MPVAISIPSSTSGTSRERRVGSSGHGTRSVSVGGSGRTRVKSSTAKSSTSSTASSVPPILRTSSPSTPPVKGILLVNKEEGSSNNDHDQGRGRHDAGEHAQEQEGQESTTSSTSTASSYLKPLLKYLPRHIDPSTIARLLKNVHPSAFGSYRTKEAWRREHPEVLDNAYYLQALEDDDNVRLSSDDVSSSSCLAHSPPSATFSSSEDDQDEDAGLGDFDDYVNYKLSRSNNNVVEDDDEFDKTEVKELEDYFNDEFDADLGTSPESASSLRDLTDDHQHYAWSNGGNNSNSSAQSTRTNSQDSNTTSATAKNNDNTQKTSSSSSSSSTSTSTATTTTLLDKAVASLTSPTSPLAIYLSKPDEERDSPLAGPSQRVLESFHNNDDEDGEANDSGATITIYSNPSNPSSATSRSRSRTSNASEQHRQPIASTSAAILYPDFKRQDSGNELTPKTPPSPSSGSSLPPSPSSLSPRYHSNSPQSTSSTRHTTPYPNVQGGLDASNRSRSPPQHYPTIPIPRVIRRQTSSSSIASKSSACTCHSNASSAVSTSSRSSSIRFAPLPEEEIAAARRESRTRNGAGNDKSRVMGIKGRRNLLLGINNDNDEDGQSPAGTRGNASSARQASYARPVMDESEEDDSDDDLSSNGSSSSSSRNFRRNGTKDQFDALAYFGEEDLLNPPAPLRSSSYGASNNKSMSSSVAPILASEKTGESKAKKGRQDSDVTIRYGKHGELVERRPLGVTLEELTLPMKRVKETRGRSRQTNDLSASFTSPKISTPGLRSPPLSPPKPSPSSTSLDELATSPSDANDASHEKTPMPTPKLEKKRFEMFTNITPLSPPSSTSTSTATASHTMSHGLTLPLSPPTNQASFSNVSSTSPSHSLHSSTGSNDITPMPTPRAGSPIAGLKMTTSIFEERGQAASKGFKLVDTFTTSRGSGSSPPSTLVSSSTGPASNDEKEAEEVRVPSASSVLALGNLLDEGNGNLETPSPGSSAPSMTVSGSSPEADVAYEDEEAEQLQGGPNSTDEDEDVVEYDEDSEDGDEESDKFDMEKTPTLHASLDLPRLSETTHTLHARYRKKRSVGLPHGVTAKKKPVVSSRKSKKS
ncbi:hypothetical protein P389DRAFT_83125 [Cystobasidium minutum MCA 4210]|uniref:uncharacterized protein n=1 Tax=Cystobasidium minutum MCA 4210 TaxID=1397322 RepID=UPI0034CE9C5F|eukprot:jgi/Rhomi1/83125/CE83124_1351